MRHIRGGSLSKLPDGRWRPFATTSRSALVAGMMAPAAWLLTGCAGGGGVLISTVALPSQQTTGYGDGTEMPLAADAGRMSGAPEFTPGQKDYLGALAAAGIHPASELRALSIGAYVCQARAAGQSDQVVWDSVAPMVRSDVIVPPAAPAATATAVDANSLVSNVIRIATGRLC